MQRPLGNNNNPTAGRQQQGEFSAAPMDENMIAALFSLQQMGLLSQLQNAPSSSSHSLELAQNEFLKGILKAHFGSTTAEDGNQQQNKVSKEISRRRPSLMHDSGASSMGHQDDMRYPRLISDSQNMLQMRNRADPSGIGSSLQVHDPQEEDDRKQKRILDEHLDRLERERIQATNALKNAQKKARTCEMVLRQEPLMLADEDGEDGDEDSEEGLEEQSPADALIERIYAENRRRTAVSARNNNHNNLIAPPPLNNVSNEQLRAETAARLAQEYERGVQLLPSLVQAMRIQRERRQDALENRRIIYEEQLSIWERKVTAYERSQKKLAKDAKHRELFEKTFIELRKMREEKERNMRVERSRFSLAQGGNGITGSSEAILQQFMNSEAAESEHGDNEEENVDEKAFTGSVVPPTYITRPSRFFDDRNLIVENASADASAQLEAFQNQWTDMEKAVFMEKIGIYGKNFAAIAAFLPSKSVKESVQFYYMTKKRNNYKQKFGRRRKKIGRQGYRPPLMPRFGDTDENVQLQNYGRECTFVECLLCSARILVLESLNQLPHQQHFDSFGPSQSSSLSYQQQIPICTKCQSQTQRNRTLNRCPLGSCACVGGKRKMRPVRNMPEKFASLGIEHKRFLIHKLKIPPSANKCCTNCFKRISKDIDGLLVGEFQAELEAFSTRALLQTDIQGKAFGRNKDGEGEGARPEEEEELWRIGTGEEPPLKELKLEAKEEEEIENIGNETKEVLMKYESAAQPIEDSFRFQQGSITKGIPNRNRSTLLGNWDQQNSSKLLSNTEKFPFVANIVKSFTGELKADPSSLSFEDVSSQLGIILSKEIPNKASNSILAEKGITSSSTGKNVQPNAKLHQQIEQQHKHDVQTLTNSSTNVKIAEEIEQKSRDNMRRKSGLVNVLLSTLSSDNSSNNNSNKMRQQINSPRKEEEEESKQKSLIEPNNPTVLSSPYFESLSEDSDEDKPCNKKENVKKCAETLSGSSAGAAPLNFLSLLDLMDDDDGGTSFSAGADVPHNPSSDSLGLSSMRQLMAEGTKRGEGTIAGKGGGREGKEECLNNPTVLSSPCYEPLSDDET